jgi:hypothetical protein
MSKKKDVLGIIIKAGGDILSSDKVKKTLLGEYTDGTTRNVMDAFNGEYLSPKTKKKHKKHKKNKKKHPEKYVLKFDD